MPNDPILHLLGLARKAGRLEIGEEPVGAVCRARQARLVLFGQRRRPQHLPPGRPLRRGRKCPVAGGPLHQGGAGLRPGPGFLRHAGPDGRRLCRLPHPEAGRPRSGALRPRRPAAPGEGRPGPSAAAGAAAAREKPPGGQQAPWAPPPPKRNVPPKQDGRPAQKGKQPPRRPAAAPLPIPPPPAAGTAPAPAPAVPISPALAAAGCPASSGTIPKK